MHWESSNSSSDGEFSSYSPLKKKQAKPTNLKLTLHIQATQNRVRLLWSKLTWNKANDGLVQGISHFDRGRGPTVAILVTNRVQVHCRDLLGIRPKNNGFGFTHDNTAILHSITKSQMTHDD